jgi:hypothetical protein
VSEEKNQNVEAEEAVTASHIMGVSTAADEYGPVGDSEGAPSSEVLADGVEPDYEPDGLIFYTFAALFVALVVIGGAVGSLVVWTSQQTQASGLHAAVDPRLDEVRVAAREVLTSYARVEENGQALYRVPVDVAFRIVEAQPGLLAGHPLGERSARMDGPGRQANGAAIGQDWAPVYLDGPPVVEVPLVAEGSGGLAPGDGSGEVPADGSAGEAALAPEPTDDPAVVDVPALDSPPADTTE